MKNRPILLIALSILILLAAVFAASRLAPPPAAEFDAQRAYGDVVAQVNFGPRYPGSEGHAAVIQYIADSLNQSGWSVEIQQTEWNGVAVQNIVASRGEGEARILLGAHYDTRRFADKDPDPQNREAPVPGANDGASGVAVLLEIARVLPVTAPSVQLVFFDAEDQGGIEGQNWSAGAEAYVSLLNSRAAESRPEAVVVVDMIGDSDQQIYYEQASDQALKEAIWQAAAGLGYDQRIIPTVRHNIIDDHLPFIRAGIAAVDMIDIDYAYWHTTQDTADKVSPESLAAVGKTLLKWLNNR